MPNDPLPPPHPLSATNTESAMDVGQLRELIEDLDDDVPVRIAHIGHRSYFEYAVEDAREVEAEGESVFYLEEGHQVGYLPAVVREALS